MYRILCDEYPLLDLRDDELKVFAPKVGLEVNTVGSGSFTIYKNHPYYDKMKKRISIFEVRDEIGAIFRGIMTDNSFDFNNGKAIDLEGLMAFFNDSIVGSFNFPEDFLEDADYITASESGNVVKFFLNWLIDNHNSQVMPFQQFKLGNVTVSDPNNYITRSSEDFQNTWEALKTKLFESSLGGYLCIRYEDDGNYIDYLSEFTLTNTQKIVFGENLLDLKNESSASEIYTACIPIGAEIDVVVEGTETTHEGSEEGTEEETEVTEVETQKVKLTLESIPDGNITEDIVKVTLANGAHALYSLSGVERYGWKCANPSDTTWDDVTEVDNLKTNGIEFLQGKSMLSDTIEITAADLHFTDEQIQSFRIYRKVDVESLPHNLSDSYDLTKLDIDCLQPQNTKITVGATTKTFTDQSNKEHSDTIQRIESAEKDIEQNRTGVTEAKQQIITQSTTIINTCNEIILGALESYVETGDYEEFKETVEAQLALTAEQLELNFSKTTTEINNVNGDLQETITKLEKHFDFSLENGLIIKAGETEMKLRLDNDVIRFYKGEIDEEDLTKNRFGWWDGVDFHTGNIVVEVEERAQFGNFAFIPRSDGSLMFLKVGDA